MITFPEQDTFPLGGVPKFVEEHFGIDYAEKTLATAIPLSDEQIKTIVEEMVNIMNGECDERI